MGNLLTVPKLVLSATVFVYRNFRACLFRALPIVILIALVGFLNAYTRGSFSLVAQVIEAFLYAVFAVSWHRYSLLPEERNLKGLPYQFGLREIKFGITIIATGMITVLAAMLLIPILTKEVAAALILLLMLFMSCVLAFVYPAIALDQPIQTGLFLRKGFELIFSFILGALAAILIFVIPIGLLIGLSFLIGHLFGSFFGHFAVFLLVNVIGSVAVLAIAVSTASFLFRDVIGLREVHEPV